MFYTFPERKEVEIHFYSVAAVTVVAREPPHALTEQYERRGNVQQLRHGHARMMKHFLPEHHGEHYAYRRSEQSADYRKPAEIAVIGRSVIQHRTRESARNGEYYIVKHEILIVPLFERGEYARHDAEDYGNGYYVSVPVHLAAAVVMNVHALGKHVVYRKTYEYEGEQCERA